MVRYETTSKSCHSSYVPHMLGELRGNSRATVFKGREEEKRNKERGGGGGGREIRREEEGVEEEK